MKQGLTFDDVLLVPKHGVLKNRSEADISSELVKGLTLDVPIVSANMPSVTGSTMAQAIWNAGGYGFLHRFNSIEENVEEFKRCRVMYAPAAVCSLGLKDGIDRALRLAAEGCETFCLDVAHGDHEQVIDFIKKFKIALDERTKLIVGNIATEEAAVKLAEAGVEAIKVGIGPGAACKTREVTGFGVPQLTAIMEVAKVTKMYPSLKLIADGGIKNSGDIVKALAAGADTVMIGSLLAGCDEAPNPGEYYGNASEYVNGHRAPEGIHGRVEYKGSVEDVIKELAWGIRSGLSYGGATNLAELRQKAEFIQVTAAGQYESQTRLEEQIIYPYDAEYIAKL